MNGTAVVAILWGLLSLQRLLPFVNETPNMPAELIDQRRADVATANGVDQAAVPPDAGHGAGGFDPDISPEYALLQVNWVAAARGPPVSEVNDLVKKHIQGRPLGFTGQERVNVLELNVALAAVSAGSSAGAGR